MWRNICKRIISMLLLMCMLVGLGSATILQTEAAATPASSGSTTATLAYTLKNLRFGVAVQNYYIGEQYIYITQRSTNITYLSRLEIEGSTASYVDHMTLKNWGHGETLDFYRYNGQEYFLVGTKASADTDKYWSTQIARIQYEAGKTYDNYTGVTRFTTLNRCNSTAANDGDLLRVAAAVCGNYTIFRIQFTDKTVRYSIYDTNKLNAALDSTTTSVYLEMKSSAAVAALVKTFKQSGDTYVHPNNSFQGIELSSKDSIYLSGGGYGDTPQIAMMNSSGSYKKLYSITNVGNFEIEGMQTERGRLYFLIMPDPNGDGTITAAEKKDNQKIYYISESVFGINHTLSETAGTAPTCTTAGISNAVTCTTCGCPQEVQETLPPSAHTVVTVAGQAPTTTAAGWTESSYCSVCNAVLVARQELSALRYAKGDSEPLRLVIDYGKPVEFSIADLGKSLFYNPADVSSTFMGVVANGTHGIASTAAPASLYLTSAADVLPSQYGTYQRSGNFIRFTPNGIMNGTDRVYAIFRMTENYATSSWTWYLTVGIEIVPANMMYYEAEELAQSGDLIFEEKIDEAVSNDVTIITDTEDRQIRINTYVPTYDKNVLFFSFDNQSEDNTRYTKNSIYGGVNHDLLSNWSVFGSVDQYSFKGEMNNPEGALNLHLANPTGTWLQLRTAFSLQYKPCQDAWIEVRMRLNDVKANNGASISFCPEFFANTDNTSLRTRPSKSITLSEVGQNWFVLKFPFTTSNAWPNSYSYTDAALIRSISMTFEGMLANYGHSISIDYFYVGPEETCPSNLNSDRLYFGFDNTAADQYRYYNPIYGERSDYDKTPAYGDDWYFTDDRTPLITVANGEMSIVAGAKGGTGTDSPYVQTLQELDYSAERAEIAQVKLKLSNMTTDVAGGMFTDKPSVRIGFILDDDADYETSACWYDWPVTETQLNGCDYMTLTADITELLAAHDAKKIRAVRLTIANASGISANAGTVTVDYIYVGPKESQDTDLYLSTASNAPEQDPPKATYTPLYDDRVLFFGFESDVYDAGYYQYNKNYGNRNFNDKANWWAPSYGSITGISNGALVFYTKNTGAEWGYAASGKGTTTNAAETEFPLQYVPSSGDWCEIRLKIDGAVANSNNQLNFILELFPNSGDATARVRSGVYIPSSKIGAGYFVLQFPMVGSALSGAISTSYTYATLPIIRRINFLVSNVKKSTAFTTYIDYFYIGPQELMPSKMDQSYLYFGFENDEAAQYKYTSAVYGANYDNGSNWMYNTSRSSAPTVANGMMTATVTATGLPWFETRRNGNSGIFVMNYYPNTAPNNPEEIQVRVRFNNVQASASSGTIGLGFYDASNHKDATSKWVYIPISGTDVTTNGKWFTYRVKVGTALSGLSKVDSIRINFSNVVSSGTGTIDIDYIYIGPSLYAEPAELANDRSTSDRVYGYDSLYTEDIKYSDHKTLFAEGKGVALLSFLMGDDGEYLLDDEDNKLLVIDYASAAEYTEARFTFCGTGFDIISQTGEQQGGLRVVVCDANGYVKKTVTVINKGITDLYQIPVVSVKDLDYGAYTVHVFVNAAFDFGAVGDEDEFGGALDRGGEFYFDAVRIYNPINTNNDYAYSIYQSQCEAEPIFTEVRQMLIDASKESNSETLEGVAYVDTKNGNTAEIVAYTEGGPNNEVYLASKNGIKFKLEVTGAIPASIDIGAKSADGTAVTLGISINGTSSSKSIATNTQLYYPLPITSDLWQTSDGKSFVYVTISNGGSNGILSITDIKYAYAASAETLGLKSVRFLVDAEILDNLATPCEHAFAYTNNGENHTVACTNCDDSATEAHNFVDGTCVCGAVEVTAPKYEHDENLTFNMSISVGAEMQVVYTIPNSRVKNFESFYLEVVKEVAGGESVTTIYSLDADNLAALYHSTNGNLIGYQAFYTGIFASEMGDNFTATLYAISEDGTICYGQSVTSSIQSYLSDLLAQESTPAALKTLAVDMLNYGAAAQGFFDYDTENLVNADLTDEQKALGTQTVPDAVDGSFVSGDGSKISASVSLQNKVMLYLTCMYASSEDSNLKFVVKDSDGNVLKEVAPSRQTENVCQGIYSDVGARQMRELLTIELYDNDVLVSETLTWSVESYVASVRANDASSAELIAIANAMLAYGDSAAIYFEDSGR